MADLIELSYVTSGGVTFKRWSLNGEPLIAAYDGDGEWMYAYRPWRFAELYPEGAALLLGGQVPVRPERRAFGGPLVSASWRP